MPSSSQVKMTSAPSERPIQFRCIVTTWSGQDSRIVEVVEEPVGVVGDLEEPLLELLLLDERAAALAVAVDDLLVGEDGGVDRAPLDGRLGAVGEAALEEAKEEPLGPAVVVGVGRGDLARPVDRDAPALELLAEGVDGLARRLGGVLAGADRVVLGGQAEGVVAHRVDDVEAAAAAEVGDRVADGVVLEVADVGLARGVGQHLEDVGLGLRGVESGVAGVGDLPGALGVPDALASAPRWRAGRTWRALLTRAPV